MPRPFEEQAMRALSWRWPAVALAVVVTAGGFTLGHLVPSPFVAWVAVATTVLFWITGAIAWTIHDKHSGMATSSLGFVAGVSVALASESFRPSVLVFGGIALVLALILFWREIEKFRRNNSAEAR